MKQIKKDDVLALPIIFGNRRMDNRDLEEFYYPFRRIIDNEEFTFWNNEFHNFAEVFLRLRSYIEIIDEIMSPLAVFLIISGQAAREAESWDKLIEEIKSKRDNIFVYTIVWGYCESSSLFDAKKASFIYFNGDAITAGARRMTEYLRRIVGEDLEGDIFPAYDMDLVIKMADHINCEDFNSFDPRRGAIPKYPIRDGKPFFPVLCVEVECPICKRKKEIGRFDVDGEGGAKTECFRPENHEHYFAEIGKLFDPWPELYNKK